MQNRGSPVNRIPIMAKDVLDLFRLYQLVVEKGGLVEARAPWTMESWYGSVQRRSQKDHDPATRMEP